MMETDAYDGYGSRPPFGQQGYSQGSGYGNGTPSLQDRFGLQRAFGQDSMNPNTPQQGCVLMVYGLGNTMNCDKMFNLFCLYGNVVRVKFLKSKEGSAMIQLGDHASCERAITNLHNSIIFENKLQLSHSKQAFLNDVPNPHDLPDGTPSFQDYMGNRNNRFTNPEAAQKNRIQVPTRILHYFNAPPQLTEDDLNNIFKETGAKPPSKIKQFPSKTDRSSTGLLEWDNKNDSMESLICANHAPVANPNGKHPFIFKLCFSATPIIDSI